MSSALRTLDEAAAEAAASRSVMDAAAATPPIWIDALSNASLAAARRLCEAGQQRSIRYLAVRPPAGDDLVAAGRAGGIAPLEHDPGVLRTRSGAALAYQVNDLISEHLRPALRARLRETGLSDTLPDFDRDDVLLYLYRAVIYPVKFAVSLTCLSAAMSRTVHPVLLIDAVVWALIADWPVVREQNVETYATDVPGSPVAGLKTLIPAVREFAAVHRNGITTSGFRADRPRIAQQLCPPTDDDPVYYPWYSGSGIAGSSICVYSDRPDAPLGHRARAAVEREGHVWINFRTRRSHGGARGRRQMPYLPRPRATLREKFSIAWLATRAADPFGVWEARHRLMLLWQVALWEALFRRHRVTALLQFAETGTLMIAQTMAVNRAGGISVGWHWSHYGAAWAELARRYDVFCAWGPYYRMLLEQERGCIRRIVYTGLIPTRAMPAGAEADPYRSRLHSAGAEFIVCLFDTSFGSSIIGPPSSERRGIELYERLVRATIDDPSLGLLVKPKNPDMSSQMPAVWDLLRAAERTGRVLVLPETTAPRLAARASDLVIGFGFNSAAVECAILEDRPVVYADLDPDPANAFYRWGANRIVFDNLDDVIDAVRAYRVGNAPDIGDHRGMLSELDPFRDGRGPQRLGAFMKGYLNAVTDGLSAGPAVERACEEYRRSFGERMVVELSGDDARRSDVESSSR